MSMMWSREGVRRRSVMKLVAGVLVLSAPFQALASGPAAMAAMTPDEVGLAALDEIVRGDYAAATARFDPSLQKKLSVTSLQQGWAAFQRFLGSYQSHGDPELTQRDDLTVVNLPLRLEREPGQFRVSVRPDGTVTSLFFLRQGVPV